MADKKCIECNGIGYIVIDLEGYNGGNLVCDKCCGVGSIAVYDEENKT